MARLAALFSLFLCVPLLAGCGLCQNCQDVTGPVMQAPNQPDYYNSPRVGSAVGTPVADGQIMPMQEPAELSP